MPVLRKKFDEDGFIVLPHFLNKEQLEELEIELQRYITTVLPTRPDYEIFYEDKAQPETLKQIQHINRHDAYFDNLIRSSIFSELAEELLGQPVVGINMQYFNKPPLIGKPTPPHQDTHYFMISPHHALTMWLALDEVNTENGCVRYLPGSHSGPLRIHAKTNTLGFSQGITDYTEEEQAEEFFMPVSPGALLVHHCLMIHRADGNQSNRTRKALGFIYYAQDTKVDRKKAETYQRQLAEELRTQGKI